MLSFEEKMKIIDSFPQLSKKNVSLGRVNYQLEESVTDKKNVVFHLHPNGNGFVYGGEFTTYETTDKGYVNIRDFDEESLRLLIQQAIEELSFEEEEVFEPGAVETWVNEEGFTLTLMEEDDLWNVYADDSLDGTFTSYGQAITYLDEEGFSFQSSK